MPWYLYVVECRDQTLYTGITTDISRRIQEHNAKKGAFYTQNKTPVELVYQEAMPNQSAARKREAEIKRLTRKEKLELIGSSTESQDTKTLLIRVT
jgi:putative endonuclease